MNIHTDIVSSWRLCLQAALAIAGSAVTTCVLAAPAVDPLYRITDIGTLGGTYSVGHALNESGQVTGSSALAGNVLAHAFLWKNDGKAMIDLGPFDAKGAPIGNSHGSALNAAGQVTGSSDRLNNGNGRAFLWKNDGTPMLDLGTLGGASSEGDAINDNGQVAGQSNLAGNLKHHAFIWKNDGHPIRDLGTLGGASSVAAAVNASGQVTGTSDLTATVSHAFLWRNDGRPMLDLGIVAGTVSSGCCVNAAGEVVGQSTIMNSTNRSRTSAFLWRNDGTRMVKVGGLGGTRGYATGINDFGQVIGVSALSANFDGMFHGFFWRSDGTPAVDLANYDGASDPTGALDVNAAGWVVGYGTESTTFSERAILWRDDGHGMRNLNDLIDPADPLKPYVILTEAFAINNAGDILAYGNDTRGGGSGTYFLRGSNLALNPRALAFGSHPVNTTSAAKSVTVTNTSGKVVAITSIALKGAAPGQFAATNNCGSSLVGHATCTIKVTFKPTTKGAKSATLNVNGGGGGLRVVNLTGTGT